MKRVKWWAWILIVFVILGVIFVLVMFIGNWGNIKDIDYNNPPKFVTADFIDLSKIDTISKFRSGMGHDYSGNGETCRSMRHYFGNASIDRSDGKNDKDKLVGVEPDPATAIQIYAPADGWIMSISGERTPIGKQMEIIPKNGQGWHIRLDHVYPAKGIHIFSHVESGQLIGLIQPNQTIDMTILYHYRGEFRLTSYFQVMTDEVFAKYQARGIKNRSDMIIPKELVDANPWQCERLYETANFLKNYADTPEGDAFNSVHLSGWINNWQKQAEEAAKKQLENEKKK